MGVGDSQRLGLKRADSPEVILLCPVCHVPCPPLSCFFKTERQEANLGEDTRVKVKG